MRAANDVLAAAEEAQRMLVQLIEQLGAIAPAGVGAAPTAEVFASPTVLEPSAIFGRTPSTPQEARELFRANWMAIAKLEWALSVHVSYLGDLLRAADGLPTQCGPMANYLSLRQHAAAQSTKAESNNEPERDAENS